MCAQVSRLSNLPVDSGWAWMVMMGALINNLFGYGFLRSLSIFFLEFLDKFEGSVSSTTLAFGLNTAAFSVSSLLVPSLFLSRYSARAVALLGAAINAFSICALAFAPNLIFIYVIFIMIGIAAPLMLISQTQLLGVYFKKRLSFAMSASNIGVSIATMASPKLTQYLLEEYGLQGALLIHGALNFHNITAALLFRNPSYYSSSIACEDDLYETQTIIEQSHKIQLISDNCKQIQDLSDQSENSIDLSMPKLVYSSQNAEDLMNGQEKYQNIAKEPKLWQSLQEIPKIGCADTSTDVYLVKEVNLICGKHSSLLNHGTNTASKWRSENGLISRPAYIKGQTLSGSITKYLSRSSLNPINVSTKSLSVMPFKSIENCNEGFQTTNTKGINDKSTLDNNEELIPKINQTVETSEAEFKCTSCLSCCLSCRSVNFCDMLSKSDESKVPVCLHPYGVLLILIAGFGLNTQLVAAYMPSMGKEQGIVADQLPYLLTVLGAFDFFKIVFGVIADKNWVSRTTISLYCTLLCGLLLQFISKFDNFPTLFGFCAVIGAHSETLHCLLPGMIVDWLGVDYVSRVMSGYYLTNGLNFSLTHVLIGVIKDRTGSFIGGYQFMGSMQLFSVSLILIQFFISSVHAKRNKSGNS